MDVSIRESKCVNFYQLNVTPKWAPFSKEEEEDVVYDRKLISHLIKERMKASLKIQVQLGKAKRKDVKNG